MSDQTTTPEEVEEVTPVEMIEMLSEDLTTALQALKKITLIKPQNKLGGPGNKNFGRRFQQCFEEAQTEALEALLEIHGGQHTHGQH